MLIDRKSVAGPHLRPHRHRDRQLRQQPETLRLDQHEVGIQHRQGEPDPRRGRLEEGRGRHPRQGRQEAEVRLPDLDQHAAPEDPGDRQAGVPEGRHRPGAEVGDGVGVLLVRRRQSGHLSALLLRHPDVHDDDVAARSRGSSSTSSSRGKSPPRRTSGRAATSRAGSTRRPTRPTRPRKASSIRSSAPRC